jgi:hypothetical protein
VDVNAPNERLLDALMQIKRFQDGSLGFRKSCAHGVCGSDAMRINGKNGLACKTLIKEVAGQGGRHRYGGAPALSAGAAGPDRRPRQTFSMKVPFGQALPDQRRTRAGEGAHPAVPGRAHAVRRHHQLHLVRFVLFGLPGAGRQLPHFSARPPSAQSYRFLLTRATVGSRRGWRCWTVRMACGRARATSSAPDPVRGRF